MSVRGGLDAGANSPPLRWVEVLEEELRALHPEEGATAGPPAGTGSDERLRDVHARIHRRAHSALCLSGGGIRSATFALGVLQGLAHARLLGRFDYLSTVSGGGYTGGSARAWLSRAGPDGRQSVFTALDPAVPDEDERRAPIEHLRRTCRYLAPRGGNRETGYRPASQYGSDGGGEGTGISLGMALAVSGAAASPEMGMYSNKARAFLLTLANARLGLWFGNPRDESVWRTSDPPLGLAPLVRELLGLTTDRNPYVYLSDGGHYENLGLSEMVSRRCRFIIVSDAGCDPGYAYDDLANATRRIRLDLGIPVLFPPLEGSRAGQGHGNPHGAVGLIRYSVVDGPEAPDGVILYLKATLSGDEPVDVRNFAATHPAFPHDPTSDQFFDEARFESYRTLGLHTVLTFTNGYDGADGIEGLCDHVRRTLADAAPHLPAGASETRSREALA